MKKILSLVLISILVFTGCANKEETKGVITCKAQSNDVVNGFKVSAEYKINYKGSIVESVNTTEIVTSDSQSVLDEFETTLNSTYEKMDKAYGGYTYNISKEDNKVTSIVNIDYNKMDLEQLIEDQPAYKNYMKDNKLLVDGLKMIYQSMGATCE